MEVLLYLLFGVVDWMAYLILSVPDHCPFTLCRQKSKILLLPLLRCGVNMINETVWSKKCDYVSKEAGGADLLEKPIKPKKTYNFVIFVSEPKNN